MSRRLLLPSIGLVLVILTVIQVLGSQAARAVAELPVPPAGPRVIIAEGRVASYPDADVTVGSDVAGTIERLLVQEKQSVRKGQLIAELDADDLRAEIVQARARVAEAEADIRLFETEVARMKDLFEQEVGSRQAWDRAARDADAARARRATARAEIDRLGALLEKTRIVSPIDGVVVERFVSRGETIREGAAILRVADLQRSRIEAEIDEFDAGRVILGSGVAVTAEGVDAEWRGVVEEIPDAVVSRRLKPRDPAKPVDTRVLLVKVSLVESAPLKLGQRVEVAIETR